MLLITNEVFVMAAKERFIVSGIDSIQDSLTLENTTSFTSIKELIIYVKEMKFRSDYLSVFDQVDKREINLSDIELI